MSRRTRMFKPPGVTIRLHHPAEDDAESTMTLVHRAIEALSPSVSPLALDLEMGLCFSGTTFFDRAVFPEKRDFHIRESLSPPRVELKAIYASEDRASLVPVLTTGAIRNWCMGALRQPSPDSDRSLTFKQMWCVFARARYFALGGDEELILADAGGNTWPVPILRRDGGLWAPGPLVDRAMDAPASFVIENVDGELSIDVQIGWELWSQTGEPEHEVLQQSLHGLLQLGWTKP